MDAQDALSSLSECSSHCCALYTAVLSTLVCSLHCCALYTAVLSTLVCSLHCCSSASGLVGMRPAPSISSAALAPHTAGTRLQTCTALN